jgi:flavin-dependent dehydrogenase
MKPDVLIAGAGPAGAVAALVLARAGVRVRLLERASLPRDKLCGDTINPGALAVLRRLGIADEVERAGVPIHGMIVTGSSGVTIAGRYPEGTHGVSLRRRELDAMLVARAIEAGAELETGVMVRAPVVESSGRFRRVIGLEVSSVRGTVARLQAPIVIAADGRRSRLAFALKLARHPARPRRWAIGAYFERIAGPGDCGEMHVRAGRYIGVAPVPGGLTNACVVVPQPRCGALCEPAALLSATLARDALLADRFASARMVTPPGVLGPLAVDTSAAGLPGLLLAGDAAGFIDPMTGDGLRFAFRGAELAAEAALRGLDGSPDTAALALAAWRRAEFGGKWRMNRALRALVASPAAIAWAAAGARVCPALLRQVINAAGDVEARSAAESG